MLSSNIEEKLWYGIKKKNKQNIDFDIFFLILRTSKTFNDIQISWLESNLETQWQRKDIWRWIMTKNSRFQSLYMYAFSPALDACPTGYQEVAGSTPAGLATFFRAELTMKYFLWSFSPFHCSKKGSCQFLAKECAQYWFTAYRTKPAQEKSG